MATNNTDSQKSTDSSSQAMEASSVEEVSSTQKVRVKIVDTVSEGSTKVKELTTASSAVLHNKLNKVKRTGLLAVKKVATWLSQNKKTNG